MAAVKLDYESVAVTSRIRLARNFKDYPFPARLLRDPHAVEQAGEMIHLLSAELTSLEDFTLYEMDSISPERAAFLQERNLISRDLLRHRGIAAALVSSDECISVMINEEDHVREQYFLEGFDLRRAYERIAGIDEIISDSIPFAYDAEFGYLTACPTNVGTGMRASVMLFLPALARRGRMKRIMADLKRLGLTVRGASGEGSGTEGELFQVSNEVTLGVSEVELLKGVEQSVRVIVEAELLERGRMKVEEGIALKDRVMRAYGLLANCCLLGLAEFSQCIADVKLGVALGYFGSDGQRRDDRMKELDQLLAAMRPASIDRMNGGVLGEAERSAFRAEYVTKTIRGMELFY